MKGIEMAKQKATSRMMTLDQLKDKHLGRVGMPGRNRYEFDLKMELLSEMIKAVRKERNLTQEELGKLIGVQKAQISKLERSAKNVTLDTILRVFEALQAKVTFSVEVDRINYEVA
jgi:HTH-type transcriptional regulator / antitoxin HipB